MFYVEGMEKKVLKIGQISDIHIGEDASLMQGIDVRKNFLAAYCSESMKDLDLLVLSGDLAYENAEPGAYVYISNLLKDCKVPVCIIPGNIENTGIKTTLYCILGAHFNGKRS